MKFSIITVVRNDPAGVVKTLQSVFDQQYDDYELIVQDGASTDETSDVLRGFGSWIDHLTIESDLGIYDGMNRALRRATGDYVIFMNAADYFINNHVLAEVAKTIDPANDDVFVGEAISDETGKAHKYRPQDHFWVGSTFDHQAAFIRTSIMKQFEYDQNYKICGDLHFFTKARKAGARFRYSDIQIARKPFAIGASSDFTDRVRDRYSMLHEAWGAEYPVKTAIAKETALNTMRFFDLNDAAIPALELEELLSLRDEWDRRLRLGDPNTDT